MLRQLLKDRDYSISVERLLFALVVNRALAPTSKLAMENWVGEEAYIPGLETVEVHQLYRVMDTTFHQRRCPNLLAERGGDRRWRQLRGAVHQLQSNLYWFGIGRTRLPVFDVAYRLEPVQSDCASGVSRIWVDWRGTPSTVDQPGMTVFLQGVATMGLASSVESITIRVGFHKLGWISHDFLRQNANPARITDFRFMGGPIVCEFDDHNKAHFHDKSIVVTSEGSRGLPEVAKWVTVASAAARESEFAGWRIVLVTAPRLNDYGINEPASSMLQRVFGGMVQNAEQTVQREIAEVQPRFKFLREDNITSSLALELLAEDDTVIRLRSSAEYHDRALPEMTSIEEALRAEIVFLEGVLGRIVGCPR